MRPRFCQSLSLSKEEGAGNAGCPRHPPECSPSSVFSGASVLNIWCTAPAQSHGVDAQNLSLPHQAGRCQSYDMSTVKRQNSELRDEYAALTRGRIVAAFVESLGDGAADEVSMAEIGRASCRERVFSSV